MNYKKKGIIALSALIFVLIIAGSYVTWNRVDPEYTCARCHEVSPTHERWKTSAHAGVSCIDCHGTAVSGGFHSLSEKMNMVLIHFTEEKTNDEIRLSEAQRLQINDRCIACHQSEYAGWLAGGHAVNYGEIFMDSVHNAMEKPYWDCFRCHGMFYDGNIHDLMDLDGEWTEWKIRDKKQETLPAVPCLACHQMHTDNAPLATLRTPFVRNPKTALYMRADKMYLRSDRLTTPKMQEGEKEIAVSSDPNSLLCMQCHAPNFKHQAGSEDDRTVTGVHEGISCVACHRPHSGETRQSCLTCHPSLTEEEIQSVYDKPHTYSK
jgi:hypothetical protein